MNIPTTQTIAVEAMLMADNGGNNPIAVEAVKQSLLKELSKKESKKKIN